MKTIITSLCVFIAVASADAQLTRGMFGYGFSGPWVMGDGQLYDELNRPSLLGSNLQQVYLGVSGGGSGYVLLGGRFVIGGTGFSYSASDNTARGQLTTRIKGGIGQVGFVIINRDHFFVFPYVGIGHNNARLRIRNNSNDVFDLGNLNVAPGEAVELRSSTADLDFGISMQHLVFRYRNPVRTSGLMLGLQAGATVFAGLEDWHDRSDHNTVAGSLTRPVIFTPYFRISIGGGGFRPGIKDDRMTRN